LTDQTKGQTLLLALAKVLLTTGHADLIAKVQEGKLHVIDALRIACQRAGVA